MPRPACTKADLSDVSSYDVWELSWMRVFKILRFQTIVAR